MADSIHLIEKLKNFCCLDKATNLWESPCWAVSEKQADALVGGQIFFHKHQIEPSYYGGTITGYRVGTEGDCEGRIIFQFIATAAGKGVKTRKEGWGMEKKIIRDAS